MEKNLKNVVSSTVRNENRNLVNNETKFIRLFLTNFLHYPVKENKSFVEIFKHNNVTLDSLSQSTYLFQLNKFDLCAAFMAC